MKRIIAIVAGGDTSEYHVSLRSAQGLYSFIDKERYELYIVVMHGLDWYVQLDDDKRVNIDRNDFSFTFDSKKVKFDSMVLLVKTDCCKAILICSTSLIPVVVYWQLPLLMINLHAISISSHTASLWLSLFSCVQVSILMMIV